MQTQFFPCPTGTLAYDDTGGSGQTVLLVPGMGDIRQEYRLLAPRLADAGYRVVSLDMRGHGDSSTGWPDYTVTSVGHDILALLAHLNAGAVTIVGTSFAAGAAVCAAAEQPAAVAGLVLIGPFVRDHPISTAQKILIQLLFAGPWRAAAWVRYYQSLYPTQKPADLTDYCRRLRTNLAEPGRFAALKAMMAASKQAVAERLAQVQAPTLVVMGSNDPDFPDPTAEARWIAEKLNGAVAMIDQAGHYPHVEMPDQTAAALVAFLAQVQMVERHAA